MLPKRKNVKQEEKKDSPYTILNKWLNDKSKFTPIPQEILDCKEIGPQYLLYYFQSSPTILYLSDVFNNFNIYQMELEDVLKMMKDICLRISFRPRYIPMGRDKLANISKKLKKQYPYLKNYEIGILVNKIDTLPERDDIYESFGLLDTKKKKTSKENKEALKENIQLQEVCSVDKLLEDF
jgi:hypothetical protein